MRGIFIDTGIFVAARNRSDIHHIFAKTLLSEIQEKEYGEFYTSDYIFDEAIILMGVRVKQHSAMRDIGDFILGMPGLRFQYMSAELFELAWKLHYKYDDRLLSFTDATIIAWCQRLKIPQVATIDAHFGGILSSIMPDR